VYKKRGGDRLVSSGLVGQREPGITATKTGGGGGQGVWEKELTTKGLKSSKRDGVKRGTDRTRGP